MPYPLSCLRNATKCDRSCYSSATFLGRRDQRRSLSMEWDRNSEGAIAVAPVLRFQTAVFAQTLCVVRIEFVRSPEQLRENAPDGLQLALTPKQALELG